MPKNVIQSKECRKSKEIEVTMIKSRLKVNIADLKLEMGL